MNSAQEIQILADESNPTTVSPGTTVVVVPAVQDKDVELYRIDARSRFTKEMAARALADGASPGEFLLAIAVDPNQKFLDYEVHRGKLTQIERHATLEERKDAAKAVLPYYHAKKVDVQHSGQISILHALAESPLDNVTFEEGEIIDDVEVDE